MASAGSLQDRGRANLRSVPNLTKCCRLCERQRAQVMIIGLSLYYWRRLRRFTHTHTPVWCVMSETGWIPDRPVLVTKAEKRTLRRIRCNDDGNGSHIGHKLHA